MAATTSPIIPNGGANISAPTPLAIELSATPGTVTELHLPQNASTLTFQITTISSGHDIDIGYSPGGQTINLATGEIWTCPVRLTASQKIYFSSTHASATFRILIGQLPG